MIANRKSEGALSQIPVRAIPLLFYILSLTVSVLIAAELITEPGWMKSILFFRYFPIYVGAGCILFSLIFFPHLRIIQRLQEVLKANIFWTLFLVLAVPGVIYAKFFLQQETTYLSEVIGLSSFFLAYYLLDLIPYRYYAIIRKWVFIWLGVVSSLGFLNILLNIIQGGKTEPAAVLLFMQGFGGVIYSLSGLLQLGVALVFIFLSILTFKNVALLNLAVIMVIFFLLPKNKHRITKTYLLIIFLVIILVLIIALGFYFVFEDFFSGGHVSFRYRNTIYQLNYFLDSPLWGQLFAGETRVYFGTTRLLGDIYVPTHNDWADVLAQGGSIGMLLMMGGFLKLFRMIFKLRRNEQVVDHSTKDNGMWVFLFAILFIITGSLNSLLGTPSIAIVAWFVFAFFHKFNQYALWSAMGGENGPV